ncbi:MAG TPA: tetratricopeptide repeat-containing protein kinase family protein, partial [Nannocystaceae bacterium]|nr:tetratricopeptide repeat-containing protein kinase family protein [Nannocystaceae bacterium]
DQFAFCVALFEALHGVPPFAGETIADLARAVERGEIQRGSLRADVPAWVQRVVMRGLQHDPRDRFRDMDELVAALGRDPTRRRRGVALAAAALVIAVGAWGTARWLERREHEDCVGAVATELGAAWSTDARARVDAAFRATASRSAADTSPRVAMRLDRVTARLHELASASCDRPAPEPTQECFARVGAEIDELVDVFEHADADVVRSAISAIEGVTPPEECVDTALAAELAEPTDAVERDGARTLRRRIARLSRRAAASRREEALVEAERVIAEAERLGDRPTLAEALLARANIRRRSDDLDGSVADGERALQLALASGHDVGAVEAAEHLAWVVGYLREDVANGRHWLGIARALFERLPGAQQLRGAKLESTEGQLAWAAGEYELAAQHHRRVLDMFVAEVGEQDLRVGGALQHLGEAALELGQFDDALTHLERALAIRTAELGEVHPLVAISLATVGTAHLKRREIDLAEQFYRRALEVRQASGSADDVAIARDWGNLANVLVERGRYHEAIAAYESSLRIKEAKLGRDDVSVALTLLNLGRVRHEIDDDAGAEADYRRALAIRERVNGPDHPDVAVVLNNLALLLRTRDRAAESRAMLERVVEIRERALGRDHPMTASGLGNLAVSYRDAGDYERALTLYAESLATLERAHGKGSPALAKVLGDYGMAAFDSGDAPRAAELVARALDLLATSEPHGPLTAWTRFRLAKIRWQLGQHTEARTLADAALPDVEANNRAEVDAWIAAHAVTAPGASTGGSR